MPLTTKSYGISMDAGGTVYTIIYLASIAVGWLSSIAGYIEFKRSLRGGSFVCRADSKGVINCKSVYMIPQAFLLGRIHMSEAAPPYFTAMLILSLIDYITGIGYAFYASLALVATGFLMVPYLIYLEVRIARAICLWCTIMHLSLTVSFIIGVKSVLAG